MARALVEKKLCACVQISEIESFFTWDGGVHNDEEFRVWCKTTSERYQAVETAIREMHPYELPAIFALPLEPIYPPYATWIASNTVAD